MGEGWFANPRTTLVHRPRGVSPRPAGWAVGQGWFGSVRTTLAHRPLTLTALGDTGLHLGAGLYFGHAGHHHGEWRGEDHLEGERVADCTLPDAARELHQIRDAIMSVDDPVGGGRGWCNLQTTVAGAWPAMGLDEEPSFV